MYTPPPHQHARDVYERDCERVWIAVQERRRYKKKMAKDVEWKWWGRKEEQSLNMNPDKLALYCLETWHFFFHGQQSIGGANCDGATILDSYEEYIDTIGVPVYLLSVFSIIIHRFIHTHRQKCMWHRSLLVLGAVCLFMFVCVYARECVGIHVCARARENILN